MDIGISTFLTDYSVDVAIIARRIEELGFDSLWVPEPPHHTSDHRVALARLAGRGHPQGVTPTSWTRLSLSPGRRASPPR